MTVSPATIEPPQITVGAVVPHLTPDFVLAQLYDIVAFAGAEYMGWLDVVSLADIPPFELLSDLANVTQTIQVDDPAMIDWQRTLRVWFRHRAAGAVAIGYGAARRDPHPVIVTVGGTDLAEPSLNDNGTYREVRAREVRTFIHHVFHRIVLRLDPLYSSVQVEDSVPSPGDLSDEGASIGSVFFLSTRVIDVDRDLVAKLTENFSMATVRLQSEGLYVDDSTLLDPDRSPVPNARRKGVEAARLIAGAVARMAPS